MRLPLHTSVVFWWNDKTGTQREGQGRSRDISERGTCISTALCPHVGATIALRFFFDAVETVGVLRMEAEGRVLRVERGRPEEPSGEFAVSFNRVTLADARQNSALEMVEAADKLAN